MEIKKSYEYSVYKSSTINISFKDAVEYQEYLKDLRLFAATGNYNEKAQHICVQLLKQLEAPCS